MQNEMVSVAAGKRVTVEWIGLLLGIWWRLALISDPEIRSNVPLFEHFLRWFLFVCF